MTEAELMLVEELVAALRAGQPIDGVAVGLDPGLVELTALLTGELAEAGAFSGQVVPMGFGGVWESVAALGGAGASGAGGAGAAAVSGGGAGGAGGAAGGAAAAGGATAGGAGIGGAGVGAGAVTGAAVGVAGASPAAGTGLFAGALGMLGGLGGTTAGLVTAFAVATVVSFGVVTSSSTGGPTDTPVASEVLEEGGSPEEGRALEEGEEGPISRSEGPRPGTIEDEAAGMEEPEEVSAASDPPEPLQLPLEQLTDAAPSSPGPLAPLSSSDPEPAAPPVEATPPPAPPQGLSDGEPVEPPATPPADPGDGGAGEQREPGDGEGSGDGGEPGDGEGPGDGGDLGEDAGEGGDPVEPGRDVDAAPEVPDVRISYACRALLDGPTNEAPDLSMSRGQHLWRFEHLAGPATDWSTDVLGMEGSLEPGQTVHAITTDGAEEVRVVTEAGPNASTTVAGVAAVECSTPDRDLERFERVLNLAEGFEFVADAHRMASSFVLAPGNPGNLVRRGHGADARFVWVRGSTDLPTVVVFHVTDPDGSLRELRVTMHPKP